MARKNAQRLGLTFAQRGDEYALYDGDQAVFCGDLTAVEEWLLPRVTHKPPGPAAAAAPNAWAPCLELFTDELQAARQRPQTVRLRKAQLVTFARRHPGSDPLTVTRDDLARYIGTRSWSPHTAHSVRAAFRVFFGFLHDHGHRDDDPSHKLPAVKVPRSKPRPCPDSAIQSALTAITDERVRLAIRLGAETGLRRAEISKLRSTDVLGCAGSYLLHVADGKGGHQRTIPIGDDLAGELCSVHARYVFRREDGQPFTPNHLGRLISRALPDQWAAHSLRHRFATTAYQASKDLRAVQELLGHQSPTTTAIYTDVGNDALRCAATAALLPGEAKSAATVLPDTTFEAVIAAWDDESPRCEVANLATHHGPACRRCANWRVTLHGCRQVLMCGQHLNGWKRMMLAALDQGRSPICVHCEHTFYRLDEACTITRV
jgi:site-specific recombinase XerD